MKSAPKLTKHRQNDKKLEFTISKQGKFPTFFMVGELHSDAPQIGHGVLNAFPALGLEDSVRLRHLLLGEHKELPLKISTMVQIHAARGGCCCGRREIGNR